MPVDSLDTFGRHPSLHFPWICLHWNQISRVCIIYKPVSTRPQSRSRLKRIATIAAEDGWWKWSAKREQRRPSRPDSGKCRKSPGRNEAVSHERRRQCQGKKKPLGREDAPRLVHDLPLGAMIQVYVNATEHDGAPLDNFFQTRTTSQSGAWHAHACTHAHKEKAETPNTENFVNK